MKKIFFIVITLVSLQSFSQQAKYGNITGKGEYQSYISKDGTLFNVGDKITIGSPSKTNQFSFIYIGNGILTPITFIGAAWSNTEVTLKKINILGNEDSGYEVLVKANNGGAMLNILLEKAINGGEIVTASKISDEALSELKKAKDKLDLGLITQEKYDSIKSKLSKLIK